VILGIAQVVVNVADLDATEAEYVERGYERTFRDDAIANHPAKREFQGAARDSLAMVHLTPPSPAPAVELTSYGEPAGAAPYELRFDADGIPTHARFAADEESRAFWQDGMGFRPGDADGELALRAAVPSLVFRVVLEPTENAAPATMVDGDGCVLVTAVTSDVDRDLERLAGLTERRRTEPWDERVAGRDLRVAMVEGPSGELVELLQAPRRR
jgi:hypothetical protein